MSFIGSVVIPVALVLAGSCMATMEVQSWYHPREFALPRSRVRLVRRLVGCAGIVGIGALIFAWLHVVAPTLHPGSQPPVGMLASLSTLVLVILVLAVWDALDSLHGLRGTVNDMHRADMQELQEIIRQAREQEKPS